MTVILMGLLDAILIVSSQQRDGLAQEVMFHQAALARFQELTEQPHRFLILLESCKFYQILDQSLS